MPAADLGSMASTTAWIERRYEIASVSAIVSLACAMSLRAARANETPRLCQPALRCVIFATPAR